MSTTYLNGLQIPAYRDRNWHLPLIASLTSLASAEAWSPLLVDTNEHPSTSLVVTIAAGGYIKADGTLGSYAGGTLTVTASATTYLWLTDAGVLTSGSAWPAASAGGDVVRLAIVVAGTTSITSVTPARVLQRSSGGLRNAHTLLIGPTSGSAAAPTWRALAGADIPVFGASGGSHSTGGVPDPGASAGTTRFLREDATWAVPAGAVTSVGLAAPAIFTVSNSPVTSSGTLTLALVSQPANLVLASPVSGIAAAPTFRALVGVDIPVFGASGVAHTPGGVPDPGSTVGSTRYLCENATWVAPPGVTLGTFSLTNQTAAVAAVTWLVSASTPNAQLYEVSLYAVVTAAGTSGNLTVSIQFADDLPPTDTITPITLDITTTGSASAVVVIESVASNAIKYMTGLTGTAGSLSYNVYGAIRRVL